MPYKMRGRAIRPAKPAKQEAPAEPEPVEEPEPEPVDEPEPEVADGDEV